MHRMWSFVSFMAIIAVIQAVVVPRYDTHSELKYEGKRGPYDLPHHQDLQQNPLSHQSYPWFYHYPAPYYFPNHLPYYPLPHYNNPAVLENDAKQGNVNLKAPVYNLKAPVYNLKAPVYDFKAPAYNLKAPAYNFKAPAYNFKAPAYNFKAPAFDFKAPEDLKAPNYRLPQYAYAPFPLKQDNHQHQQIQSPPAPPPAPEPKPAPHQEYKEVEIFPEIHEATPVEHVKKQIVHKDEPANRSFIFIGKYSGSCQGEKDGLYYVDKKTFAYCVDQRDVFQPCPEGTENPNADEFMKGKLQYSHHFCSVNLLAQNPEPVPTHADPHYNTYQYEEVPEEKY